MAHLSTAYDPGAPFSRNFKMSGCTSLEPQKRIVTWKSDGDRWNVCYVFVVAVLPCPSFLIRIQPEKRFDEYLATDWCNFLFKRTNLAPECLSLLLYPRWPRLRYPTESLNPFHECEFHPSKCHNDRVDCAKGTVRTGLLICLLRASDPCCRKIRQLQWLDVVSSTHQQLVHCPTLLVLRRPIEPECLLESISVWFLRQKYVVPVLRNDHFLAAAEFPALCRWFQVGREDLFVEWFVATEVWYHWCRWNQQSMIKQSTCVNFR